MRDKTLEIRIGANLAPDAADTLCQAASGVGNAAPAEIDAAIAQIDKAVRFFVAEALSKAAAIFQKYASIASGNGKTPTGQSAVAAAADTLEVGSRAGKSIRKIKAKGKTKCRR